MQRTPSSVALILLAGAIPAGQRAAGRSRRNTMRTLLTAAPLIAGRLVHISTVVKTFALVLAMLGTSAGLAPPAAAGVNPSRVGRDPATGVGSPLLMDVIDWTAHPASTDITKTVSNDTGVSPDLTFGDIFLIEGSCQGSGEDFLLFTSASEAVEVTFSEGSGAHGQWFIDPALQPGESITLTETITLDPNTSRDDGLRFDCTINFYLDVLREVSLGVQNIHIDVPIPPVVPTIIDENMVPGETAEFGYRLLKNFLGSSVAGIPPDEVGRTTGDLVLYPIIAIFPQDPIDPITPIVPVGGNGCQQFFDAVQLELISNRADPDDFWIALKDRDPPLDIFGTNIENVLIFTGELVQPSTLGIERLTVSPSAAPGDFHCVLDFWVAVYRAGSPDPVVDPATFIGRQEIWISVDRPVTILGPFTVSNFFETPDCFFQGGCTGEDFPVDWGVIRTFDYSNALIPGDKVIDIFIDGTWGGNFGFDGTAPVEVYLEGILVAECLIFQPCWDNASNVDWNGGAGFLLSDLGVDFSDPAVRALFEDGTADLSVIQNGLTSVNLTNLSSMVHVAPEPDIWLMLVAGIGFLSVLHRRCTSGFGSVSHP